MSSRRTRPPSSRRIPAELAISALLSIVAFLFIACSLLVCANEAGDIGGVVDSASTGSDDDRRAWGGTTNSVTATSNGTWRGKSESDDKRELLMNMLESRKRLSDNDRKEQHDAGLFRKVQTRLKQMFKEQLGKGEEHHKSRDVHSAKKRQNEDVRRSDGAFHQQDEISRRRVLYEASVNTHYLSDNNAEGVAARGSHLKDQSSKLPSKALNVRGTLSALIAGGGGPYIRETGGNNGEHRAGNAKCSHYAPPMNKAEVQAGREVPHWAYSLCPERSLSKIRLEEKVNADSKFNSLGRSVQRIGEHWSEIVQTDTSLSLSLGKYVPPTQDSDTSLLSNAYRSHLVLWQDTEAPGPRFGAKRGTGVAAASGEGAEILNGIISYYGGGDECGDGLQLTSRVLTLEGCCPEEKIPPQGENHSIDGGTDSTVRILAVEEAIACFYNFLVCNECRDGDIAAVDSSPNVGPDKPSIVGGSPGFDPAQNTRRPRDEAAHTYIRRLPNESLLRSHKSSVPASFPPMPMSKKQSNLKLLRQMFQRSYDSYMYNAYPAGELKPISCGPGTFDLVRLPALTLIDSLGSLVVMGNFTEFARSVERLRELDVMMQEEFSKLFAGPEDSMSLLNRKGGLFGVNQNVSVFETNIRALGGLLSAHQLAVAFLGNGVVKKENVWDGSGNILIGDYENFDEQTMDMKDNESVLDERGFNRCPSKCDLTLGSESSTALPCLSLFEEIGVEPDRLAACQSLMKKKVNTTSSGSKQVDNAYLPWVYDGLLLSLATDLGTRLLPAFSTDTGIPYGTVNLLYGVPPGETSVASLAGGGTLSIEMELLSRLTGDPSFGSAARLASRALWMRQSKTFGLLGKHIDVHSGDWVESLSGIGSNSDSFYEYLIKHHVLFPDDPDNDLWSMFVSAYDAVCTQNRMGHWYADVEMNGGRERGSRLVFESLMAFWPGLQVLAGELPSACQSADAFSIVREQLGMLPERFDVRSWRVDGKGGLSPLRPELLESIYFLHMATAGIGISVARGDSSLDSSTGWQWAADFALHALHDLTKTQCGHATVSAVHPNTTGSIAPENLFKDRSDQIVKEDNMPSYFLSETLKYLYLTFDDDDNILHGDKEREWIFTTEAHPVHHVPVVSDNVLDTPLLAINNDYLERIIMTLEEELSVGSNVTHQNAKIYSLDAKHEKNITSDQSKWTFQTKQEAFNAFIRNSNVTFHNKKDPKSESGSRVLRLERLKSQWPALKDFESEIYDEDVDVTNLATISLNRYGKGCGSALSQACPNFHQPNLKWVLALNSNLLDYGESFPAIKSEEERVATHGNRQATALSAAATYGSISIPADLLDSAGMCAIVDHQSGPGKNEASIIKPDSHEKELAERKLKISRLNMGDPLGDFDVSLEEADSRLENLVFMGVWLEESGRIVFSYSPSSYFTLFQTIIDTLFGISGGHSGIRRPRI